MHLGGRHHEQPCINARPAAGVAARSVGSSITLMDEAQGSRHSGAASPRLAGRPDPSRRGDALVLEQRDVAAVAAAIVQSLTAGPINPSCEGALIGRERSSRRMAVLCRGMVVVHVSIGTT